MKTRFYVVGFALLLSMAACKSSKNISQRSSVSGEAKMPAVVGNAFVLENTSSDPAYGYTEKNPIKVGGVKNMEGPLNEQRFLNALSGPNGEEISYNRLGSCCAFETPNGFMGGGLLDKYEITWKGQDKPVILYINMYDADVLMVPVGFSLKK